MFTNNSRRLALLAVALSLTLQGCATCREHPAACAIVGAIVVGSVAATIENNRGGHRQPPTGPLCAPNCLISGVR